MKEVEFKTYTWVNVNNEGQGYYTATGIAKAFVKEEYEEDEEDFLSKLLA